MGKGILWAVGIAAIVILAGVFGAYAKQFSEHAIGGPAEWGMFGDFVGGLANPLLGFLTIFLLIVSLYYQTQELAATREELAQSKEAMQQANELHDNSLLIQSRNNLRLQLEPAFEKCISNFHDGLQKTALVRIDDRSIHLSYKSVLNILSGRTESNIEGINDYVLSSQINWRDSGWSSIAQGMRALYLEAAEALVALIEYSDSELVLSPSMEKFNHAKLTMGVGRIYDEQALQAIDMSLEEAVERRENMPFPPYHKKATVY
ncbi:hypothetical protein [Alcanivorax sp.]|uniref:hypothetical protein n=1 Tax=Alcanivorax sp. TaxID=1872427 RepID=UPI0025C1D470|nr:hypothetical protein [Alcanivorax sp.]